MLYKWINEECVQKPMRTKILKNEQWLCYWFYNSNPNKRMNRQNMNVKAVCRTVKKSVQSTYMKSKLEPKNISNHMCSPNNMKYERSHQQRPRDSRLDRTRGRSQEMHTWWTWPWFTTIGKKTRL